MRVSKEMLYSLLQFFWALTSAVLSVEAGMACVFPCNRDLRSPDHLPTIISHSSGQQREDSPPTAPCLHRSTCREGGALWWLVLICQTCLCNQYDEETGRLLLWHSRAQKYQKTSISLPKQVKDWRRSCSIRANVFKQLSSDQQPQHPLCVSYTVLLNKLPQNLVA